jgi:Fe-S oxidoreductase
MLRGDAITEGLRSDAVHEALDLCLSCKGCKSDCPVGVDMATYKAEFLAHYYRGRLRPRSAYVFGLLPWWARVASLFPTIANALLRVPLASRLLWRLADIPAERALPPLAPVTFKEWWSERPIRGKDEPPVVLWVDTWSNYFEPAVPIAATDALEHAGFRVLVPEETLCCGRPFYDYGMLDLARGSLRRILSTLGPLLRAGVPVVGLEPSCISVFRDELPRLFPDDADAQRLGEQSFMLEDFFLHHGKGWTAPRLERKALVQAHCHHRAVLGFNRDAGLFREMGMDARVLDAGCCGMAGAFGYEKDHYAVSVACAERRLAPEARRAADDTLIVADGFSCRAQIEQTTGRRALHSAQVLQMALLQGPLGPTGPRPEDGYVDVVLPTPRARRFRNAALFMMAAGALVTMMGPRHHRVH